MMRVSVACRACSAGWWNTNLGVRAELLVGESATAAKCPLCRGALVVTGVVETVDLRGER